MLLLSALPPLLCDHYSEENICDQSMGLLRTSLLLCCTHPITEVVNNYNVLAAEGQKAWGWTRGWSGRRGPL